MLEVGCSAQILEVPLFAELFGYGPFAGRRNLGTHDPLYCRAVSFHDGSGRALIIATDCCTTDDCYARELRAGIAAEFSIPADGIAFTATHTHTAPKLGRADDAIGMGEAHPEYQRQWQRAVMKAVAEALADEETMGSIEAGTSPLTHKLGQNRVEPEQDLTDPAIRWIRFLRPDGSCKLLLHNHGMHGVAQNGPCSKYVSADWMGAANRLIAERKIADMPLFLLGPCGDINTRVSCAKLGNDSAAGVIGEQYVDDLVLGIAAGGETIADTGISAVLRTVQFPVVERNAAQLDDEVQLWQRIAQAQPTAPGKAYFDNDADRLNEMIVLLKQGRDLHAFHDLQVIRIGPLMFYFVPGELFIEPGLELQAQSPSKHAFVATVANGNGGYFPSGADMRKYPSPECLLNGGRFFGFYEIYGYMHSHRLKYVDDIANFVIHKLLEL